MKRFLSIANYIGLIVLAIAVALVMTVIKAPLGQALTLAFGLAIFLLPIIWINPEYGLFLIGFCLPFERVPTLDIGGASLKINHILIVVVLFLYLTRQLAKRQLKIPRDPIRYFVLLFLLVLTFSLPVAVNFSRAIQVYFFIIIAVLGYFTVTMVAQDKRSLIIALKGVLWGALLAGVFAVYQFLGDKIGLPISVTLLKEGYDKTTFGFARVQAFSVEPLYFANYIFIPLAISLVLIIRGQIQKIFPRSLAILLSLVLLIDFILAISRGAYLAAGVVLVVLCLIQAKNVFNWKTIFWGVFFVFFMLGGVYLALAKSESRALDEFVAHLMVEDRTKGESVVMRLSTGKQAYQIFQNNPVFGVGVGNFGPVVQKDPVEKPKVVGWMIVNNEYLEIMAENGTVGLVAFVLLIVAIFWRLISSFFATKDKLLQAILLALGLAFLGILVQYATFSTLYIIHIWFLIGLIAATSNISNTE